MGSLLVTKLECARRQMETAIQLYFQERDPISIHTLACAAYQIIMDINKHRRGSPMFVKEEYLETKPKGTIKQVNLAQNFAKHAEHDHDESLDFDPDYTPAYITDACRKYTELTNEKPFLFRCMLAWFCAPGFDFEPEHQHYADELSRLKATGNRQAFFAYFSHEFGPVDLLHPPAVDSLGD